MYSMLREKLTTQDCSVSSMHTHLLTRPWRWVRLGGAPQATYGPACDAFKKGPLSLHAAKDLKLLQAPLESRVLRLIAHCPTARNGVCPKV